MSPRLVARDHDSCNKNYGPDPKLACLRSLAHRWSDYASTMAPTSGGQTPLASWGHKRRSENNQTFSGRGTTNPSPVKGADTNRPGAGYLSGDLSHA